MINRLNASSADFDEQLSQLLGWEAQSHHAVETTVQGIINDVRARGDTAIIEMTNKFDHRQVNDFHELVVDEAQLKAALGRIDSEKRLALEAAANRIRQFHQRQVQDSWTYTDELGAELGQKVTPMDRVGMYVPGGQASYPSSVLMTAIPAKVAGVQEVVMVSPAPKGETNDMVLAAAAIAGVDKVITIGGAQAVAAMAYGTQSVAKVDKIVGPGNIYVATAKRAVFGAVDIDMIAGPSEILVISDGQTPVDWLAMDLFSQAEHDKDAQAILISDDSDHLDAVEQAIGKLLPTLERQAIAAQSLSERGALIQVKDMDEAVDIANRIAPEHLELSVAEPQKMIEGIRHAGAIFMGRHTSESLGDYCAGPNHVLPTSGTARFSSPLGVYDYQKRSSIINCSAEAASELGQIASVLARGESLEAHARSAEYRILKDAAD